jgi:hypothetical protein
MEPEPLQYEKMVEEALRGVIRQCLLLAASDGLPGEHHFFITFQTGDDGVDIPGHLKAQHPDEMTIVLQHQFSDFIVDDGGFAVTLVFNGKPARLIVPFSAVTAFADPSVNFGLQLKMQDNEDPDTDGDMAETASPVAVSDAADADPDDTAIEDEKMGEVIALDAFRKE